MNNAARSILGVTIGVAFAALAGPAAFAQPGPAGDAVATARHAARTYAEQMRGVVTFRTHVVVRSAQRLMPYDRVEDAWFVLEDGSVVRSGGDQNGSAASEVAAHQPYDPRYTGEYTFAAAPCSGCAAGTVAIAYAGAPHDAFHARGVLVIDTLSGRILRSTAEPYVLPKPGRSGMLVTTWGAGGAGWLPTTTDGTFVGRVGPFSGSAKLTQRFSAYQRYHDVATAERTFSQ